MNNVDKGTAQMAINKNEGNTHISLASIIQPNRNVNDNYG